MNENTVEISQAEYNELREMAEWAHCLEAAGVDNWEGVEEAIAMYTNQQLTTTKG